MADISIEAFREDVDNLAAALQAVVQEHTGAMPYVDRAIIVAAALGNVACTVDVVEDPYSAGCTSRLKRIACSWEWSGG